MCSDVGDSPLRLPGFPIRKPPDQSLVDDSPGTIVASHVLHRFLVPRNPPCALKNLATDARVHCAVLKQRPATHHPAPKKQVHWGRQPKDRLKRACTFRYPTACPTQPINPHVPRRSSTSEDPCAVPSSQRSTHEQPAPNIRRCSGL